ncbi:MAG: COG1470 family protein, partial [Thermoplasmatota archaeon]
AVSLSLNRGFMQVPLNGRVDIPFTVNDLSHDTTGQSALPTTPTGSPGLPHQILLENQIVFPPNVTTVSGWSISLTKTAVFTTGGASSPASISAQVIQPVGSTFVKERITATLIAQDGSRYTDTQDITFQVKPFYQATVLISDVREAGQDELVTYPVKITNQGPYLDAYELNVTGDPDFGATIPAHVAVAPGETRIVNLTMLTPHGKLYELSRSATFFVNARSVGGTLIDPNGVNDPTVYTAVATLTMHGGYVSGSWWPLFLLGAVGLVLVAGRSTTLVEERRAQKGRPRPPYLTPRQELLLAELKKRDKKQYKERLAALAAIYVERRATYKSRSTEDRRREAEERQRARRELRTERRRRKAERAAQKKAAAIERARERKLHKERRAAEAVLAAARAKQAKEQRKLDKKAAKKQAKIDEKQAKRDAKEAKKDAKLAAKKSKELAKKRKELARAEKKAAKGKKD